MPESPEVFIPWNLLILAGVAIGALIFVGVVGALLMKLLRRPSNKKQAFEPPPQVALASLSQQGPNPGDNPRLEFYGAPARLALLVIAPSGRTQVAPSGEALGEFLDGMIPGLREIYQRDQPPVQRWPKQLSASGFVQSFFNQANIPQQGKGTPWCAIAGRFEVNGHPLLLAIVCRTAEANAVGQITAEHEGQWRDAMRVRRD